MPRPSLTAFGRQRDERVNDTRILQIRNGLMISFAVFGLLVMWSNVLGIGGAMSVVIHLIIVVNLAGLAYTVKVTGLDSLTNSVFPLAVIGLLVLSTLVRFIYAMQTGD